MENDICNDIKNDFDKIHNELNITMSIIREDFGLFSELGIREYVVETLEDIEEITKELKEKYIKGGINDNNKNR